MKMCDKMYLCFYSVIDSLFQIYDRVGAFYCDFSMFVEFRRRVMPI